MAVTESKYNQALERLASARKRVSNVKKEAEGQVLQVVQTVEVGGSAFTHALVEGYWNGVEFLGIPLPVLTGTGLHVLGFFGIAPEHLHNFGDGAYASYTTTLGLGIGEEMRRKGGAPVQQLPAGGGSQGLPLNVSAGGLSDADLVRLAAA